MNSITIRHIPSLDGIRAVAAGIVFLSHAFNVPFIPSSLGVTVFFFLSGYLITTLLRVEYAKSGTIDLKAFYIRRACRIFPPMYFALLSILLITLMTSGADAIHGEALLAQMAHLTNYFIVLAGSDQQLLPHTAVLWSLAVEEHFYLAFPLLFLVLSRRMPLHAIRSVLFAMCMVALLWRFILVYGFDVPDMHIFFATDARFDSLLYGCIMGVWCNPVLDFAAADGAGSTPTGAEKTLLAAALLLLAATLLYREPGFHKTLRYSLEGIALFPLFWLAVRYPGYPLFRCLNWAPVRWFGGISYSFYLAHPFWIAIAHRVTSGVAGAILAFGLTTLFSALLYRYLEQPFISLGRGLRNGRWPVALKEPT
jgi:peptidoglycan/LPS O-acetylase OafA/YrhL